MIDIIDRYHTPPGGWYAKVGIYDIRGDTYNELLSNVQAHARNNGVEIGDIHSFIQNQISNRWPEGRISR